MANEECIDAHHHLWRYEPEEYSWMSAEMGVLRHDYLVPELEAVTRAASVTGTVVVQARQTLQETEWLAELAASTKLIRGVVGWVPLIEDDAAAHLEWCASLPKMKGVRHVLQDEADPFYMLREDFQRGVALLKQSGLRYDVLIYERHLPQTITFVDRFPEQVFIVDHIAKPRIREGVISPWREQMRELARREHVYCKLSGVVTEAAWDAWTEEEIGAYLDVALEAFGARRCMFGSDWPVQALASSYGRWLEIVKRAITQFSADEQQRILAGTAIEAYGL